MEFGLRIVVTEEPLDRSYFDRFASMGFSCVEFGARHIPIDPDNTDEISRIREILERAGVRVHSAHGSYGVRYTMSHPDPAMREETVRQIREAARVIVALGGDVIVVHPGDSTRDQGDMDADLELIYDGAKKVVQVVSDEGARVAFENANPNGFPREPKTLMDIVTMFPADRVGVCIDTGHANFAGVGTEVIAAASGRIITTHLHDNDTSRDQHEPPGIGTIDWDTYMQAFHDAGYTGPWVFECGPDEEQAARSIALLQHSWQKTQINKGNSAT
jgi:sugar phosphate isomerase/epimerase